MFKLLRSDNSLIGTTEKVNYVKKNHNGFYINCSSFDAEGIVYNNTLYTLNRKDTDKEYVYIQFVDAGTQLDYISSKEQSLEQQLAETDEAAIQLYEANMALEEVNAEQDEAIIQIYEMIGDKSNG